MPSTDTVTSFTVFSPGTLIRSARVNANFDNWRGHLIPLSPDTTTAGTTGTYDVGSDTYGWRNVYQNVGVYLAQSTPASNPSTTTKYKLYFKSDGNLYKLNSAGTEGAIGSGGGGGGGSLKFVEQSNAPVLSIANNMEIYAFEAALAQELYATIRVPQSYSAGSQIRLRVLIYNINTSGDILFQSVSTLIRSEVDEVTSTTNQRTSTNSAITMSAANDSEPQKVILDLTDAAGTINSVAVSAGDLITVKVTRGTDTATGDINFIHLASEVTFS